MSAITDVIEWVLHGTFTFILGWATCEIKHMAGNGDRGR